MNRHRQITILCALLCAAGCSGSNNTTNPGEPSPSGCNSDLDCKGSRICVDSKCVEATSNSGSGAPGAENENIDTRGEPEGSEGTGNENSSPESPAGEGGETSSGPDAHVPPPAEGGEQPGSEGQESPNDGGKPTESPSGDAGGPPVTPPAADAGTIPDAGAPDAGVSPDPCTADMKLTLSSGTETAGGCGEGVVTLGENNGRAFAYEVLGSTGIRVAVVIQTGATDVGTFPLDFGLLGGNTFVAVLGADDEPIFDSLSGNAEGSGSLTLEAPAEGKSRYSLTMSVNGKDIKKAGITLDLSASGSATYTP